MASLPPYTPPFDVDPPDPRRPSNELKPLLCAAFFLAAEIQYVLDLLQKTPALSTREWRTRGRTVLLRFRADQPTLEPAGNTTVRINGRYTTIDHGAPMPEYPPGEIDGTLDGVELPRVVIVSLQHSAAQRISVEIFENDTGLNLIPEVIDRMERHTGVQAEPWADEGSAAKGEMSTVGAGLTLDLSAQDAARALLLMLDQIIDGQSLRYPLEGQRERSVKCRPHLQDSRGPFTIEVELSWQKNTKPYEADETEITLTLYVERDGPDRAYVHSGGIEPVLRPLLWEAMQKRWPALAKGPPLFTKNDEDYLVDRDLYLKSLWHRHQEVWPKDAGIGATLVGNSQAEPKSSDLGNKGAQTTAELQGVYASVSGRKPGKGEAAHHLFDHVGVGPERVSAVLKELFQGTGGGTYLAELPGYRRDGRRRASRGQPCRFCNFP